MSAPLTYGIAANAKHADCAAFFFNWAATNKTARQINVDGMGSNPGGPVDASVPTVAAGSVTIDTLAAGPMLSGAMDFIANATSSIFAQGWTPELQKMVGGQQDAAGLLKAVQAEYRKRNLSVVVSSRVTMPAPARSMVISDDDFRQTPCGFRDLPADLLKQKGPPGELCWLAIRPSSAVHVRVLRARAFPVDHLILVLSLEWCRTDDLGGGEELHDLSSRYPTSIGTIFNAFWLVLWFSFIPVGLGLIVASVIHRVATGRFGAVARTVLFLPQVIALVAAGIIWGWLLALPGLINQVLKAVGLGVITRAWLGDFNWALPAVGMVGVWVLLGFCIVLLQTGMAKIDPALYESARIDGASWFREFTAITVPLLRHEIGVCLTVTVIAALAAFDIIWVTTAGGPGNSTSVPGIQIYILAFTQRAVGLASALAVMLMVLVVIVILPIQWLTRESAQ